MKNVWLDRKSKRENLSALMNERINKFKNNPDRRVFYIDIKDKNKAEEFLKNLKQSFEKARAPKQVSIEGKVPEAFLKALEAARENSKKMQQLEAIKLQVMAENPQILGVPASVNNSIEERWLPPTCDEDIWIPIRPKEMAA